MPKRSSCARAYSRHSARTSQARRTFLPAQVLDVIRADAARYVRQRDDHLTQSAPPTPIGAPLTRALSPGHANYIGEITRACLARSQAGSVVLVTLLSAIMQKVVRPILGSQVAQA